MAKPNFKPRTIFCRDNLDVLRGISSGCIDLIYLDPPFNKKKVFTAPIGSSAEGAAFSDIFREEDIKDEWVKSIESDNKKRAGLSELHAYLAGVKTFGNRYNYCYLVYMAIRLIECRRVLKDTGGVYLHCDPTMSHYLKIVMDCIFGEGNFRNEIAWRKYSGKKSNARRKFPTEQDIILFYSKTSAAKFAVQYVPFSEKEIRREYKFTDRKGRKYRLSRGRNYQLKGEERKIYLDRQPGAIVGTLWVEDGMQLNTSSAERTGYPTQKPLALMERIIQASTGRGDMVLDPFCGCATTCVAAEKLGRKWAGIDISQKAYELVNKRLKAIYEAQGDASVTHPLLLGRYAEAHFTTTPPVRGKNDAREGGYVYVISNAAWPGFYKVGTAKDVERRLNSFKTSDPHRAYRVEFRLKTARYIEIEQRIHKEFKAAGEWIEAKDARAIIAAIKRADANRAAAPE